MRSRMKNIEVKFKNHPVAELNGFWVPMRILRDYPRYYLCEVKPHRNPYLSWGPSRPYKVCLDKLAIDFGEIEIK